LRKARINFPDSGINTSVLFAGNNQANVEQAHCFVEMEKFMKTSLKIETSFVYLHGIWRVGKECKIV